MNGTASPWCATYPFKLPGAQRAFVGFVFDGVRDFAREEGELAKLREFEDRYRLRSTTGGIVVQSIESTGAPDDRHLELWFGPTFGGLQFRYGSVMAYRRNALAEEVRGDWLYRDVHSQEEFDFHEPFPGLMDSLLRMSPG